MAKSESTESKGTGSQTGSRTYTHAEFTYVRRKRKPHVEQEAGELNIVPYLDIMVNLIMFLLVTQATMVSLGVIDVTAPTYSSAAPQGPAADQPQTPSLKLTVGVAFDGFYVAGAGGVLEGAGEGTELTVESGERRLPTIPKVGDAYDYASLAQKMRIIKTQFPDELRLYIQADEGIPYEVIVKTLDATRSDTQGALFPAVAFARMR